MQIKELQINGFGKLNDKNFKLNNGINLIVGLNESGKSTLSTFIKCMLFGIDKNKSGNAYSEYERYRPWNDSFAFAGSMKYTYKNNTFDLQRTFSNNSAKLYNDMNEDVSALYDKSKSRGLEVGYEQFGIDEETFINSLLVKQNSVMVESQESSTIIQKITNIIQSGSESLSYEKAKKKLEKILYDEVGTDRTATKPKYICKSEIKELETKKDTMLLYKIRQENIEKKKLEIEEALEKYKKDERECSKILYIKNKYEDEIHKEKIKFDTEKRIREEAKKEYEEKINRRTKTNSVIIIVVSLILFVMFLFLKEYIFAIAEILCGALAMIVNYKYIEKEDEEVENNNFDLVCENIRKKQTREIKELGENARTLKYIDLSIPELKEQSDSLRDKLNQLEVEYHKSFVEGDAIKDNLKKLSELEEELASRKEELNEIEKKETILEYALENLNKSYLELRKEIIPELEKDIEYSIAQTTNRNVYGSKVFRRKWINV